MRLYQNRRSPLTCNGASNVILICVRSWTENLSRRLLTFFHYIQPQKKTLKWGNPGGFRDKLLYPALFSKSEGSPVTKTNESPTV